MLLIIKTSLALWMNYSMEDWILTSHSIEKSTINRATVTKCLPDRIYIESAINWSSEIWNPSVSANKPLLPIFDILGIFSLLSALNKSTFQRVLTPYMSNADDTSKFSTFAKKKVNSNSNLYCHIWIQHEICIQMSTNKPSIGSVVLER